LINSQIGMGGLVKYYYANKTRLMCFMRYGHGP
jgi:hypothetical protein